MALLSCVCVRVSVVQLVLCQNTDLLKFLDNFVFIHIVL